MAIKHAARRAASAARPDGELRGEVEWNHIVRDEDTQEGAEVMAKARAVDDELVKFLAEARQRVLASLARNESVAEPV